MEKTWKMLGARMCSRPRAIASTSGSVCRELVPYKGNNDIPFGSNGNSGAVAGRMVPGGLSNPVFDESQLPLKFRRWLDHVSTTMTANMAITAMSNALILSLWQGLEKEREKNVTIRVSPNLKRMFAGGEMIAKEQSPQNSRNRMSTDPSQGQVHDQDQQPQLPMPVQQQQQQLALTWKPAISTPRRRQVSNNAFAGGRREQGAVHLMRNRPSVQVGKNYECETCYKKFFTQRALERHDRTHDMFQCNICGKVFFYRHSIVAHGRVHTSARPFRCADCPKAYKHLSSLAQHLKKSPFHRRLRVNTPQDGVQFQPGGKQEGNRVQGGNLLGRQVLRYM